MATLKAVQVGSFSAAIGAFTTTSIPITSVDTSKSVLFFGQGIGNATRSSENFIMGIVSNGTNLFFSRDSAGKNIDVIWHLAEFLDGVKVQHGTANFATGTTLNVAINLVSDIHKSFPLVTMADTSNNAGGDTINRQHFAAFRLLSADSLQFNVNTLSNNTLKFGYQVVEYDECSVQVGTCHFVNNVSQATTVLTSVVDSTNSFLIVSNINSDTTAVAPEEQCISGFYSNHSAVFMRRGINSQPATGTFQSITFNDGTLVQTGSTLIGANTGSHLIGLKVPMVVGNSVVHFHGNYGQFGFSDGGGTFSNYRFRGKLTSATTLQILRTLSSPGVVAVWSIIQFTSNPTVRTDQSMAYLLS